MEDQTFESLKRDILELEKHGNDFASDYESLISENRELRKTVERLEEERLDLRRRIENVSERIESHLRTGA